MYRNIEIKFLPWTYMYTTIQFLGNHVIQTNPSKFDAQRQGEGRLSSSVFYCNPVKVRRATSALIETGWGTSELIRVDARGRVLISVRSRLRVRRRTHILGHLQNDRDRTIDNLVYSTISARFMPIRAIFWHERSERSKSHQGLHLFILIVSLQKSLYRQFLLRGIPKRCLPKQQL